MHRSFALHCACTALVMALGACDFYDGPSHHYRYDDNGSPRYARDPCARYDTCATCTPVRGCGWCTTPAGSACFSDPLECADSDQFSWTWETPGCPPAVIDAGAAGDAGPAPATDAGTITPATDAGP